MSKLNYFSAKVRCPYCGLQELVHFESDIGVLNLSTFAVGDLVIDRIPPPKPYGPDVGVDWERPFWAVGHGDCPNCHRHINARIEIRDRRFYAARPTEEDLAVFAWGQSSEPA